LKLPAHDVDVHGVEPIIVPSTNVCICVNGALSLEDTWMRTIFDTTLPLLGEMTDTVGVLGAAVGVGVAVGVDVAVGVAVAVRVGVDDGVGVAVELLTVTTTTTDAPWLPAAS
jgi:hypothetical protein